jgi:hypothetical protein
MREACQELKGGRAQMAKDAPKTEERIQDAAKFLGISVTELKREVKEALIRQVANELAAESLKEWKASGQRSLGWKPI